MTEQKTKEEEWFEGKNSGKWINGSLCNQTWGFHLKNVPAAKEFRDAMHAQEGVGSADVLDAINKTKSRREQLAILAIAAYAWNGDEGYGALPSDEKHYSGKDL